MLVVEYRRIMQTAYTKSEKSVYIVNVKETNRFGFYQLAFFKLRLGILEELRS